MDTAGDTGGDTGNRCTDIRDTRVGGFAFNIILTAPSQYINIYLVHIYNKFTFQNVLYADH